MPTTFIFDFVGGNVVVPNIIVALIEVAFAIPTRDPSTPKERLSVSCNLGVDVC